MSDNLTGYKGRVLKNLRRIGVQIGDIIRVTKKGGVYEGSLMPRYESAEDGYIAIKLKSGYNIGLEITPDTKIKKIKRGIKPTFIPPPIEISPGLPKVSILSTGGTICSRIDYRTGGVRPALSASDLYSVVPELAEIAEINTEILYSLFSENITTKHWSGIARAIVRHIEKGVSGVVITHGTDTLAYTAAALSFALQDLPIPIIVVGSQRSSDRPSSDAATNLAGAVMAAAKAPFAEVVIAMHETVSDKTVLLHRGTKVRKCHTSRRDAFKSINATPLAKVNEGKMEMLTRDYRRRDQTQKTVLKPDFEEKVALIKFHPCLNPGVIEWYRNEGYRGIILEGTGLGHVSNSCFSEIQQAIENKIVIAMTSQCIWGRVNMNVYDTGRDLVARGVIPLGDMLPETALVKLMWVLGSFKPKDINVVKKLMLTNFVWEINPRSVFMKYP